MDLNTERPGFWAVLPAQVRYDAELPSTAKLLYAEISALADQRGYCFAPNSYFMKLFRISERTLQDHLRALKTSGYIRIADGDGGSKMRKIYAGINPLSVTPAENCGTPREKLRGDPAENCGVHYKEENKKEEQNPPKPPKGAKRARRKRKEKATCEWEPELFERFWNLYPRGEGKAEARYAWDDLKPDRKLMKEMSAALKRQMKTEEWLRGVGVPWAVRWLNERRWEWEVGVALAAEESPDAAEDEEDGEDEWLY